VSTVDERVQAVRRKPAGAGSLSYRDSEYQPGRAKVRQSQIAVVVLLVAYLGGCSVAAYGAAFFCLAGGDRLEWFIYPQAMLLMSTIPLLLVGLFWSRIRIFAAIVGVIGLAGLGAQQTYLDRGALYCDVP
jgi:Na+/proline symporter